MIALIFLPIDCCDDAKPPKAAADTTRIAEPSSFGAAVRIFRFRSNRRNHHNDLDLFERILIGLYETQGEAAGRVFFFDVMEKPPRYRRPRAEALLSFDQMIDVVRQTYDARNNPVFEWDTTQ
jgi:hypothetical protein